MTIKEIEQKTGLLRSNIRFYEKENLISPSRNSDNGYRDYSEKDAEIIKKIAFLRTLGISIDDIRKIIDKKLMLRDAIIKQNIELCSQIAEMNKAKRMCEGLLNDPDVSYDKLQVEKYVIELDGYWNDNRKIFKLDSVSFLYIWGSFIMWAIITGICLCTSLLAYKNLPAEIPVQWSDGAASSLVNKIFIFAYPMVCAVIRYLIRPCIYGRLQMKNLYSEIIVEYLTNYLCFISLSVEIFSILFLWGVVKNIVIVLFLDTAVLMGLLVIGFIKMDLKVKDSIR